MIERIILHLCLYPHGNKLGYKPKPPGAPCNYQPYIEVLPYAVGVALFVGLIIYLYSRYTQESD